MSGPPLEVPLVGGIDTRTDPRHVPLGKLLRGENASVPKIGMYAKRFGNTSIGILDQSGTQLGASGTPAVSSLADYKGRLVAMSKSSAWARTQSGRWTNLSNISQFSSGTSYGSLSQYTADERSVAQAPMANVDADMAINVANGMRCYVWATLATGGGYLLYATITDDATGAVYQGPMQLNEALGAILAQPKVRSVGNSFIVTYNDNAGNIRARRCDLTSFPLTWGASAALFNNARVAQLFAWDVVSDGTLLYIVYQNNSGAGNRWTARSYSESLVLQTNVTPVDASAVNINSIGLSVGTYLWVAYTIPAGANSVVTGFRLNKATFATLGSGNVANEALASDTGTVTVLEMPNALVAGAMTALVAWSYVTDNSTRAQVINLNCTSPGTSKVIHYRGQLLSRLWGSPTATILGTATFPSVFALATLSIASTAVGVPSGTDPQGTAVVLDFGIALTTSGAAFAPWARADCVVDPRQSYGPGIARNTTQALANVQNDASSKVHTVTTKATSGSLRTTVVDLKLDDDESARQTAQLGDLLYITGGVPSWCDGVRVGEVGFVQYPYATISSRAGGGALTAGATYSYAVIYSQWDNAGNLHRSAPFIIAKTLGGGDNTVDLAIAATSFTSRQEHISLTLDQSVPRFEVYRDLVNENPPIYRSLTGDMAADSTFLNRPDFYILLGGPSYTDKDVVNPSGKTLLYTTGGVLDQVNPPSSRLVCTHRDRLFFAGCPNPREIWASQKLVRGTAPGFNEALILYAPFDVTAMLSMDDKLVLFGADAIAVLTGDGPAPNGANSDWLVVPVASTVGCTEPRSMVLTPVGAIFRSRCGISLMSRGLEVKPDFGAPVEDLLATYPTVAYAVLVTSEYQVRIGCTSGSTGVELRYDIRQDAWLETKYHDGTTYGCAAVSACNSGGTFYWVSSAGAMFREDTTAWMDGSHYVPTTLEFAAVESAGTQGYQSIRSANFLGDKKARHDLLVEFAYDYGSYDEFLSLPDIATWAFEYSLKRGKSEALRVRLSDSATSGGGDPGNGRGFVLAALSFDVLPKEGANRQLPAAQRF